jgi:hypothetical protein
MAAALTFCVPLVLTVKKTRTAQGGKSSLWRFIGLLPVYYYFMVGRAIGLMKNYVQILRTCVLLQRDTSA